MKRFSMLLLIACVLVAPLCAEAFLSANDLAPEKITTNKTIDGVTIKATADKAVNVEGIDQVRTTADGDVFNSRIKLNGSGSKDLRCLSFPAKKGETLTVYCNSSSKTDARTLVVANADGTSIASLTAEPDSGVAAVASCTIPADGTYVVYSKASGINLYQIILE